MKEYLIIGITQSGKIHHQFVSYYFIYEMYQIIMDNYKGLISIEKSKIKNYELFYNNYKYIYNFIHLDEFDNSLEILKCCNKHISNILKSINDSELFNLYINILEIDLQKIIKI